MEYGIDSSVFLLLPIVAVTISQARAILDRDNHQCNFLFEHYCHGKLTIHHIRGKDNRPENLTTVCHEAHWEYLHNGATEEQSELYESVLSGLAGEKTLSAFGRRWIFPDQ